MVLRVLCSTTPSTRTLPLDVPYAEVFNSFGPRTPALPPEHQHQDAPEHQHTPNPEDDRFREIRPETKVCCPGGPSLRIPNFCVVVFLETRSLENYHAFEVSKCNIFSNCSAHGYYILRTSCILKPRICGSFLAFLVRRWGEANARVRDGGERQWLV